MECAESRTTSEHGRSETLTVTHLGLDGWKKKRAPRSWREAIANGGFLRGRERTPD